MTLSVFFVSLEDYTVSRIIHVLNTDVNVTERLQFDHVTHIIHIKYIIKTHAIIHLNSSK